MGLVVGKACTVPIVVYSGWDTHKCGVAFRDGSALVDNACVYLCLFSRLFIMFRVTVEVSSPFIVTLVVGDHFLFPSVYHVRIVIVRSILCRALLL